MAGEVTHAAIAGTGEMRWCLDETTLQIQIEAARYALSDRPDRSASVTWSTLAK